MHTLLLKENDPALKNGLPAVLRHTQSCQWAGIGDFRDGNREVILIALGSEVSNYQFH